MIGLESLRIIMKYNEVTVVSPRIHNLGDFSHCLPMLSGFVKKYGQVSFAICPRLKRFKGIKEMLMYQGLFNNVWFYGEEPLLQPYMVIDDTGSDEGNTGESLVSRRFYNFTKQYNLDFEFDYDFTLQTPNIISCFESAYVVGDRWSPSDAPDVDDRRKSNLIKSSGMVDDLETYYLDYEDGLLYNLSIIKQNPNPFITTFTGIGILADLMKKDTYILWDEDMRFWNGGTVEDDYRLHYWTNRNSKLVYIKDFKI